MKRKAIIFFGMGFFLLAYVSLALCGNTSALPKSSLNPINISKITPKEAWRMIQENQGNPNFVILDVRTPREFFKERIPGAVNLDFYAHTFNIDLSKLDRSKTYLVYCKSGVRSNSAIKLMQKLGFKKFYHINEGIDEWKKDGLPIASGP